MLHEFMSTLLHLVHHFLMSLALHARFQRFTLFVALPYLRFIYHSNFPNAGVRACALVSIILRLVVVVGLHMVSGDTSAQRYSGEDICWKATHVQAAFRLTKRENG